MLLEAASRLLWIVATIATALVTRALGTSCVTSVCSGALFSGLPATILFANYDFYTFPVATIVAVAAWAALRFATSARRRFLLIAYACLATLAMIRASYAVAPLLLMTLGLTWAPVAGSGARSGP